MKNKKGFTLIELLAVIVILAIIALIAVPVILNILDKSNKSAFKDTAYGIISAGELYFSEQQLDLNGMSSDAEFTFPTDEIDIKGDVPAGTVLKVNTKGQVALAVSNGRYCITKGYSDNDITITEDEECYFPGTFGYLTTTKHACIAKGETCTPGETLFTIKVNKNETKNFYVLNDDGNKATLIMSENLGNTVKWISGTDYTNENNKDENPDTCNYSACNDEGPITAIQALEERTADWNYIIAKDYTYSGIGDDGTTRKYEDIVVTTKARMLTYGEANAIKAANNGTIPPYMYGGKGYWTSTAYVGASGSYRAWNVSYNGNLSSHSIMDATYDGVRPVIELSK